jgi:hypothetical protein
VNDCLSGSADDYVRFGFIIRAGETQGLGDRRVECQIRKTSCEEWYNLRLITDRKKPEAYGRFLSELRDVPQASGFSREVYD